MRADKNALLSQELFAYRACKDERSGKSTRRMSAAPIVVVASALVIISEIAVSWSNYFLELIIVA